MTTGSSEGRAAAIGGLPERIAFLGFGLIGGSIALALREAGYRGHLAAWTPAGVGPAEGLRRGILDSAPRNPANLLDDARLVILAGPPGSVLEHLAHLAGPMRDQLAPDATITDVASTKGRIIGAANAAGLPFVGGHPMAGREASGVEAARAGLFIDRSWVVVPTPAARQVDTDRVLALAVAVGARPIEMGADEHDVAVAAISHLPLVLAAALVESVAGTTEGPASWPLGRVLAAGGWTDMTRLARGDPEMGAGILATNGAATAARLRTFRRVLDAWIEAIDPDAGGGGDVEALRDRLREARRLLESEPPR